NADIRPWLASHPRATSPYTRTRIGESYDHIDRILERFSGLRHERALDIGCGSGFDTFALAARFERVTAVDASRRRTLTAAILVRRAGIPGIRVQRVKAEDLRSAESYDFVYCNIMSEL